MKKRYFLFAIVFLAVAASPNGHAAARVLYSDCPSDSLRRAVGNKVHSGQAPRFFADNRPLETPDKGVRENAREETRSDSKPGDAASSRKAEKPGLKPFVPSEKIEADQVVDFPYDI